MNFNEKPSTAMLAGAFLAFALGSQAQTPSPGVNVLDNPQFNGQSSTFQTTDGPFAAGWNYTPGYNLFSSPGFLVSQTLETGNLYYYDISFNLGTTKAEGGVDFALYWDGSFVQYMVLAPSASWSSYNFQVTADGPSSGFGLVGNTAFWSSLDNLNLSWNGGIDPPPSPSPVPDAPLSFGLVSVVLLGMAGAGGIARRLDLGVARSDIV
jgi:hypothetical protein